MPTNKDDKDLQYLIDLLVPAMNGTRQRRKFIENEWLLNYRTWQGWPSQTYQTPLPDNAVHYFLPHARKATERTIKRRKKLLLPETERFQALAFDGQSHANAEAVHTTLKWILQEKIPVNTNTSSLLRCLALYDFAIQHTSAMIENEDVWPSQKVVDPFNFYIFPDTAYSLQESLLIFEDSIIPFQVYNAFVNKEDVSLSLYEKLNVNNLTKPDWPYHLVERLAYKGLTNPDDLSQGTGKVATLTERYINDARSQTEASLSAQSKAFVALSKVYFRLGSHWYFTVICTNYKGNSNNNYNCKIVRLDDTESTPLYRWTTTRPLPGELYTNSETDDIRVLQNLANNAMSQVEAHRATFAEPPLLMDASLFGRMENKVFGNRKVWLTEGNPTEGIMPFPVQDTASEGIRAWQIYKGLIEDGATGQVAQGDPGRNMPRSGEAAGQIMDMSLLGDIDVATILEENIYTPGLKDIYHIVLEYIPDTQLIKIPNKNANLIKAYKKTDITGNYSFTWLGALGFQGLQQKSDKFAQFMSTVLNPQLLPILTSQLAEQGIKLDIVSMMKTWYTYGLGEQGLSDIFLPMTEEEIQQYQQQKEQASQQDMSDKATQQMKIKAGLQGDMIKADTAKMNAQVNMQKGQIDLAKAKLDFQGKLIDIKSKAVDMHNKSLQPFQGDRRNNA